MSSIVGTQPPGFVVSGSVVGISVLTKIAATAYAVWQGAQFFAGATQPAQQVKTAPVSTSEAQTPPTAQLPPTPNPELGTDSLSYQEPTPEPVAAPLSPVQATQTTTIAELPKPEPAKVQSPIKPGYVPVPVPVPDAAPGSGIAGGVQLPSPWGGGADMATTVSYGSYRVERITGVVWDSVVWSYSIESSDTGLIYIPRVELKNGGVTVYAHQFSAFSSTVPSQTAFDTLLRSAEDPQPYPPLSVKRIPAENPAAFFLPARAYVPKAIPQPEPTPAYTPEPAPNPFQPVPSTPPDTETLPMVFPTVPATPGPTTTEPVTVPLPEPLPDTEFPSLTPNETPSVPSLDADGKPLTYPPVLVLPSDVHVIGKDVVINSGKIQPTLNGIATEVGRIENKLAKMFQPNGSNGIDWTDLFLVLEALSGLFESPAPEAIYRLVSVCEKNAQGEPISQSVEEIIPAAPPLDAIVARLDALVPLVQGLKDFKQPTCSETPTPSPLLQDPVSINWISDGFSPESGRRVKKLFRYFDESGASLLDTTIHWKDFVWNAGPFMVSCNGTTLGKPQVWAASNAEGRRVIEHAAAITGCDMSKVEWVYGTSRSPRYGMPGVMRVHRNEKGVLGITKRDGPNGLPPAYA